MYDDRAAGIAGSAESIQILARRASIVFAAFSGLTAWYLQTAAWQFAVGLALAYTLYSFSLCRRKAPPGVGELFLSVALCAGLTLAQAGYSDILYHLLLLRMALRVGRRRAVRVALIIAAVQLGAAAAVTAGFTPAAVTGMIFNLLGAAVVTYAAIYIDALITRQASDDKQMLELIRQNDRNYRMALTDALTGLYNHRAYKERIDTLSQYVLLVIDIDHFKKLNDAHGHLIGDNVLVSLGNIIKASVRSGDLAFRYGGEEFVVVLPGTTAQVGLKIAERLRNKVVEWQFEGDKGRIPVTVSIGLAVKKPGMNSQVVFEQADRALYRAKQLGRNNVQSYLKPEVAVKYGM
ncbi:GGDEF domain-containing protein [Anaeroselena agilis]|uniref:GGDEF domain-containing protein n=1 Tax=Anaeroselena agilis TaxID=3063788 RepID=A0ABU3P1R9_9FIRM|nr:GGDEF domain-containing protein [Selenomonadales bacterium 4137-cl]